MRVYTNVPEGYSNDIHIGMPAELRIGEFPNRVFTGKIAHTSGAIDTGSRTLLTEVQVPNPKSELMPGAYAEVTFRISSVEAAAGDSVEYVDLPLGRPAGRASSIRRTPRGCETSPLGATSEPAWRFFPVCSREDLVVLNPPDSLSDGDPVSVQQSDNVCARRAR